MRRRLAAVAVAALAAAGCSTELGRTTPECDTDAIDSATIISAQSVAGAAYVPCVDELRPGWSYEHLQARRGQTRFWLSSDRVGQRFLEVTFEASCDLSGAVEVPSDEVGITRWAEDVEEDLFVEVVVIPEGDDQELRGYADEVAREIGAGRVEKRLVRARVDASDRPTLDRIESALDDGAAAVLVGPRELEEGTVEVHLRRGRSPEITVWKDVDPDEAVEEIAEPLGDPTYRAVWYYPFEGGCVTYRFDAEGIGAEHIAYDVMEALGFRDLAPIREIGESAGYEVP